MLTLSVLTQDVAFLIRGENRELLIEEVMQCNESRSRKSSRIARRICK